MNEYDKLRFVLEGLEDKSFQEGEAGELAVGTYKIPNNGSILPLAADETAQAAFNRASNLVQSWGPKILQRKLDGIVGAINWSSKNPKLDTVLSGYDLKALTLSLATDLVIKGSAGLALSADEVAGVKVYRLSGFLHALRNPENPDEIISLIQSYYSSEMTQTIKLFKGNQTAVWLNKKRIGDFARFAPNQVAESEVSNVAFYASMMSDEAGQALGEVELLSPKLKSLMSLEARILRVSEASSFPRLLIKGQVKEGGFGRNKHTVSNVIQMEIGGDASYLESSTGTKQLLEEKAELISNLNEIATLPAGFISADTPSGDALKEVNQAFNSSLNRYTDVISTLLTQAFRELLTALGLDASDLSITVAPNLILDTTEELNTLLTLIDKRILPASYIARRLQNILPDLTDQEAEEIVKALSEKAGQITAADLLGAVGA